MDASAFDALTTREQLLVEAVAERVVVLLGDNRAGALVDAQTLAARLGVTRDTVYGHAVELGGQRIGEGPRGRLRFDPDRALEAWTARCASETSDAPTLPATVGAKRSRRRARSDSEVRLLSIRGEIGGA